MKTIYQLVLAFVAVTIVLGAWLAVDIKFPYHQYQPDEAKTPLIPSESYEDITEGVSTFLWGHRSLDLVSQSFVILAAVMCCLAMLKVERRS